MPDAASGDGILFGNADPGINAKLAQCYECASLLACVNVKGHAPDAVREFGTSTETARMPDEEASLMFR